MNLSSRLRENAAQLPDKDAFRVDGETITWRELDRQSSNFAHGLVELGVNPGDRVAIMLSNSIEFVISYWGAIRAGAVASPISTMYREAELAYVLRSAAPSVLVVQPECFPLIDSAWAEVPHLREVVATGEAPFGVTRFATLLDGHRPSLIIDRSPDDLCALHFTSGTTGRAKGVMITHRNWWVGMMDWHVRIWELRQSDRHLVGLPLFHTFGLMMTLVGIATGATIRLMPRWDVNEAARFIETERISVFSGVPTMYVYFVRDVDLESHDLATLRLAVVGGAPIPEEIQREFVARTGVRVVDWYGCTGWASTTTPLWDETAPERYGSLGKKLPFDELEMKIVDEMDCDAQVGEIGEIIVRGPSIPPGFWRLPDRTTRDFRQGWFYTGDLGRQDSDGFYYLVERKDDLIITSGYNVYPREVEEVIYTMPQVYEAAVVGVPDPIKGELVKAFIVLRPGTDATEEEVIAYCRQRLAAFKAPRMVGFLSSLPKSPNGKLLRRELRQPDLATTVRTSTESRSG